VTETLSPRQVVEHYYAAYNRQDWAGLDDLTAATYVHHSNAIDFTFEEFRARTAWLVNGIHGLQVETLGYVCDGAEVAVRWVARGTHLGSLNGERPTTRTVEFPGITVFRVEDGAVIEDWQVFDERHLYVQLSPFVGFA
jgi:predicted ester cyclase